MLQAVAIREHTEKVLKGLRKRNLKDAETLVQQVLDNDLLRRDTQKILDDLKSRLNSDSRKIGELMKAGNSTEATALRATIGSDKERVKILEGDLDGYEKKLLELLYKIPNVPHEKVPAGSRAEDNIIVSQAGVIPDLAEDALPHWELIKKYDIIDFDLGNKISGAGFPVYKGKGARLQRALINFFLDEAEKQLYQGNSTAYCR